MADPATMRRVLSDKPPGVLNIGGVRVRFLPDVDIEPVDELMITRDGLLNVVPSSKLLREFPAETLTAWCVKRGVYQLPTEELLDWLFRRIAGRNAIEISAGNGVIGRTLGIPTTDSYQQTQPHIASYYHALGQEPITPPPDVERVAANTAVRRYEPEVVIGAWVTQIWRANDTLTVSMKTTSSNESRNTSTSATTHRTGISGSCASNPSVTDSTGFCRERSTSH